MDPALTSSHQRTASKVAVAAGMPVGPALIGALAKLRGEPMTAETAVDIVTLWSKAEAWMAAQKMVFTTDAVAGIRGMITSPDEEARMLAAQEIACATHLPYASMRDQIAIVDRVSDCLPASWAALDRGELSLVHLKAIEKAVRNCSPRVAQAVDEQVVPLAVERGWTPGETARAAAKLVIALDPDGAADRAANAKDRADVRCYPRPDEVATIEATGDAVLAREIMDAINDRAETMSRAGDDRNVGVRRFHALADLVLGSADHALTDTDCAQRPATRRGTTLVGLDLATLLGLNRKPGELAGYGPITADTARRVAADTTLRRLVTDPLTGDSIDLGRRAYRPSAALRRAVQATHPTCAMPGCTRPSIDCEVDHRREYDRRINPGSTDRRNLQPLRKMHHQLKTNKYWHVDVNPDGSETWISLLGYTHTKRPAHFPLPDPLPADNEPPPEIADRLPETADPDPPRDELPEPPPLTDEEYEQMSRALDLLDVMDLSWQQWCDRHYDEARATGLVA